MITFFDDLVFSTEPLVLRIVLTFLVTGILFASTLLVKRYCPSDPEDSDAIIGVSATVAVIYAMFIGFIIFYSLSDFDKAVENEKHEAASVNSINYEATFLPKPVALQIHQVMKDYLEAVINKEWPALHVGKIDNSGTAAMKSYQRLLMSYHPVDPAEINIWTDLVQRANDLRAAHNARIDQATDITIVDTVWFCLTTSTLIMLLSNSFFYFRKRMTHYIFLLCIGSVTAALIFLEINIDRPYRGYNAVTPVSLDHALMELNHNTL